MDETNQISQAAGDADASDATVGGPEAVAEPAIPLEPLPPITSRFLFVDVAALRAKQLRRGAKVRYAESDSVPAAHKAERVAMEEVRRGLVYYEVPDTKPAAAEEGEA
jgi:DNA-directed RNA polymerase subunit K/omega